MQCVVSQGIQQTLEIVKQIYWWPHMSEDIEAYRSLLKGSLSSRWNFFVFSM